MRGAEVSLATGRGRCLWGCLAVHAWALACHGCALSVCVSAVRLVWVRRARRVELVCPRCIFDISRLARSRRRGRLLTAHQARAKVTARKYMENFNILEYTRTRGEGGELGARRGLRLRLAPALPARRAARPWARHAPGPSCPGGARDPPVLRMIASVALRLTALHLTGALSCSIDPCDPQMRLASPRTRLARPSSRRHYTRAATQKAPAKTVTTPRCTRR